MTPPSSFPASPLGSIIFPSQHQPWITYLPHTSTVSTYLPHSPPFSTFLDPGAKRTYEQMSQTHIPDKPIMKSPSPVTGLSQSPSKLQMQASPPSISPQTPINLSPVVSLWNPGLSSPSALIAQPTLQPILSPETQQILPTAVTASTDPWAAVQSLQPILPPPARPASSLTQLLTAPMSPPDLHIPLPVSIFSDLIQSTPPPG